MKKMSKKLSILNTAVCMSIIGAAFVSAENAYSQAIEMNVGQSIKNSYNCVNRYHRAGNYRTNANESTMKMTVKKGNQTGTTKTASTKQRIWTWTSWDDSGSGGVSFEYKLTAGSTFVGNIQASDSEMNY